MRTLIAFLFLSSFIFACGPELGGENWTYDFPEEGSGDIVEDSGEELLVEYACNETVFYKPDGDNIELTLAYEFYVDNIFYCFYTSELGIFDYECEPDYEQCIADGVVSAID